MSRRRLPMVLAALVLSAGAVASPAIPAIPAIPAAAADASPTSAACAYLSEPLGPYQVANSSTFSLDLDFYAGEVVTMSFSDFQYDTDVVAVDSAFVASGPSGPLSPWGTSSAAVPTLSWQVTTSGLWAFIVSIQSTVEYQAPGDLFVTLTCQELQLSAFEAPVDAAPVVNLAQAGRRIPFKFTVTDNEGAPVTDLTADDVTPVTDLSAGACGATASVSAIEAYSSGPGTLTHLGNGHYLYTLQTDRSWRGTCGNVGVSVRGVEQTADFQFRR